MTIIARFASVCPNCGNRIAEGTTVNWERGAKATHVVCPAERHTIVKPVVQRIAVEDSGVYVLPDGTLVKVNATRDKQRTYALRWTPISGVRLSEANTHEHGEWVYEQGLVSQVAAIGRKMTLAEAKQFTLRYGQCVRCGRKLVDARSVERAMGPVCVQYFGGKF